MELLKDYDCTVEYHLSKANVVADALSRKKKGDSTGPTHQGWSNEMVALRRMNVEIECKGEEGLLAMLNIKPTWSEQIICAQDRDPTMQKIKVQPSRGRHGNFEVGKAGELRING